MNNKPKKDILSIAAVVVSCTILLGIGYIEIFSRYDLILDIMNRKQNKEYAEWKRNTDAYRTYLDSFYVEQYKSDDSFYSDKWAQIKALNRRIDTEYDKFMKESDAFADSANKYKQLLDSVKNIAVVDTNLIKKYTNKRNYFIKKGETTLIQSWDRLQKCYDRKDSVLKLKAPTKQPLSKETFLAQQNNHQR